MRILIVDDEAIYCDYLSAALWERGHTVQTAGKGTEAIELGIEFRPDLLVVDWLLNDTISGIQVANALYLVFPKLRSALISAYPSSELAEAARIAGILQFIGKPFQLAVLLDWVDRKEPAQVRPAGQVALVIVNESETIDYANPAAVALFTEIGLPYPKKLDEVISVSDLARLRARPSIPPSLQKVSPLDNPDLIWAVRWRDLANSSLIAFVSLCESSILHSPVIGDLFGDPSPSRFTVLIIGGDTHGVGKTIEAWGGTCYFAKGATRAADMLRRHKGIQTALIDVESLDVDIGVLMSVIRGLRPRIHIIGYGPRHLADSILGLGADEFLALPLRDHEVLVALLSIEEPLTVADRSAAENRLSHE